MKKVLTITLFVAAFVGVLVSGGAMIGSLFLPVIDMLRFKVCLASTFISAVLFFLLFLCHEEIKRDV